MSQDVTLPPHVDREEDDFRIGLLRVERHGAVSLLCIDRPEKLNALTRAFWRDLPAALARLSSDQRTRVIVLTGAGDRAFSVGGDVASFTALKTTAERRAFQVEAMQAFSALEQCELPVIAAVFGFALGGGCELILACDFALAADTATFGLPEVQLGLTPGFGVLRIGSVVGRAMAKLLVMPGERLSAERALELGLVQRLTAADQLMAESLALAQKIATLSPHAVRAAKRLIDLDRDHSAFGRSVDASVDAVTALHETTEAREAAQAFLSRTVK